MRIYENHPPIENSFPNQTTADIAPDPRLRPLALKQTAIALQLLDSRSYLCTSGGQTSCYFLLSGLCLVCFLSYCGLHLAIYWTEHARVFNFFIVWKKVLRLGQSLLHAPRLTDDAWWRNALPYHAVKNDLLWGPSIPFCLVVSFSKDISKAKVRNTWNHQKSWPCCT